MQSNEAEVESSRMNAESVSNLNVTVLLFKLSFQNV